MQLKKNGATKKMQYSISKKSKSTPFDCKKDITDAIPTGRNFVGEFSRKLGLTNNIRFILSLFDTNLKTAQNVPKLLVLIKTNIRLIIESCRIYYLN